jgi:hypothetical protein
MEALEENVMNFSLSQQGQRNVRQLQLVSSTYNNPTHLWILAVVKCRTIETNLTKHSA